MTNVVQFPLQPPAERVEVYTSSVFLDGHRLLIVDLIDADGRTEMWRDFDAEDARHAAHGFAEGDGSPSDLIPVVDRLDDGDARG